MMRHNIPSSITRQFAWFCAGICFAATMLSDVPLQAQSANRPNVVLITVDDMNWDSVGVFGCEVPDITPNIDRLASQGMRFEHAHVTIAICQPTRAVWMTGRYPHRNGALGFNPINKGVPTLLETLHDSGYFTGIMAKVPHVVPTRGEAWDTVVKASELRTGRDPQAYYKHAKTFFETAKENEKPFFLMANSQDPHRPFAGSQQEQGRKRPVNPKRKKPKPKQSNFPPASRTYKPAEVTVPGFLPDIPNVRKEMAEYYTSVHRADEIVGSVLKALDETGKADSTIVMFLSDHGMPLPFAKTNCWYHSTRTPWIVRWPGVIKPNQHDQSHMISGVDLTPTVLDAVGLAPLKELDGSSFVPVLKGESQPERDHVMTFINRTSGRNEYPMRALVTKNDIYIFNGWSNGTTRFKNESQNGLTMKAMIAAAKDDPELAKRVELFLHRVPEEFYQHDSDPDGLKNLIDNADQRERVRAMRQQMLSIMKQSDDPQLDAFQKQLKKSK